MTLLHINTVKIAFKIMEYLAQRFLTGGLSVAWAVLWFFRRMQTGAQFSK